MIGAVGDGRVVREGAIFVSSPGDVRNERKRLQRVVDRLNDSLDGAVRFRLIRWETRHYKFQEQIEHAAQCDIVVSIFWTRLGTELPPEFDEKLPDENGVCPPVGRPRPFRHCCVSQGELSP
jgi:hypothetical protein